MNCEMECEQQCEAVSMSRLAHLRPVHLVIASAVWAAFVLFLPRLTLFAVVLYIRVRALLSVSDDVGSAFGSAHWVSVQSMLMVMTVPPALLLCAWALARFGQRGDES